MPEVVISVRTVYDGSGMEAAEADMQRAQAVSQEVQQQAASAVASTTSAVAPAGMPAAATALQPSVVAVADREGPVSGSLAEMHTYFEGLQREHAQQMADLQTAGMEIANENLDKFYAMQEAAGAMARNPTPMEEGGGVGSMDAVGEGAAAAGLNSNVMDMGRSLKTMATFMAPMVLAGGFIKAEKSAMGFNEAMNQVGTLVHGNQALMEQWERQIIQMAPALGQTPTDLAKGLYEVLSVNTPVNQAMQMLADSSKAATAGQADLFSTVQLLGGAMHAYGKSVSDVSGISDTLFEGIRRGSVRLPDLAHGLGEVLPYSAQLGVGLKDVTAAIVTLTNAGYQPAIAMTGMKELFVDLINQEKKFKAAGIDIVADAENGGITQVLKDLQTVTGGSIEKMKEFVPNIRALGPALTLAGTNSGAFNEHLKEMQKSAGETESAFKQMMKGSSGAMKEFKGESGAFAQQIGKNFNPTVLLEFGTDLEKMATTGLKWLGELGMGIGTYTANVNYDVRDFEDKIRFSLDKIDNWAESGISHLFGGPSAHASAHASVAALHTKIDKLPTRKTLHLDTAEAQAKVSALQAQINKLGYSLENGIATNIARGSSPIPAALAQAGAQ